MSINPNGLLGVVDTRYADLLSLIEVVGGASAASLLYSATVTALTDSSVENPQTGYVQGSTFARALFTTSASKIRVHGFTDDYSPISHAAELGVSVDGVYVGSAEAIGNGGFSKVFSLSAGSHTIEVVNGQQSRPSALQGTYVSKVEADAAITQTFPTPTNRVLFVIDSIGAGGNAPYPTHNGFIALLRQATSDSIVTYGWGFGSIATMSGDDPTAFVAIVQAAAPAKIVIQAGLNDYYLDQSSAATFGTRYAAMADALHTALPSAHIYAVTPIVKAVESANSFGDTLGAFRTQIGTIVSTRTGFMTLVDGTAFMTTANLDDGVHPTSYGHWLWATGIAPSLGYTIASQPITAGANGAVSIPVTGTYRATKTGGGAAFNAGFFGQPQTADFRYKLVPTSIQDVMIGYNTGSASASDGYADMAHQIYVTGGGSVAPYDGSTSGSAFASYSAGDSFWVDRSGSTVTFAQGATFAGSTSLRTFTQTGTITLDISMFTVGAQLDITPITDTVHLTAGPDANGSVAETTPGTFRATKNSGGAAFNCGFYGELRSGDFRYSIVPVALQNTMVGINFTAPAQSSYVDMLHQAYIGGGGTISGYDGGTQSADTPVVYSAGDIVWIDRTGTTLTFSIGPSYATATVIRYVLGVGGDYALDVSMFTVGAQLDVTRVI